MVKAAIRSTQIVQEQAQGDLLQQANVSNALRVRQKVLDALATIPKGNEVAEYFGLNGLPPQQTLAQAIESQKIIDELKDVAEGKSSIEAYAKKVASHNSTLDINPELLRALMRKK